MNIVEQLLKIDAGQIEVPKVVKKMYCKKLKQVLEFECVAIDAEKATRLQRSAMGIEQGEISDIDMFKLKSHTVSAGCNLFKNRDLQKHFGVPSDIELIKKLLTDGEITELYNTINDLSAYQEVEEDEIKN